MLRHIDSMDMYAATADFSLVYSYVNSCTVNTTGGRFSGGCASISGASLSGLGKAITATTELWVGAAINPQSITAGTNCAIAQFASATGPELTLVTNGYVLRIMSGNNSTGTVLASFPMPTYMWGSYYHWFDIHYKYGTTTGVVELYIDNVQIFSWTGNTTGAGGSTITSVCFGCSSGGTAIRMLVDDIYILDATTGSNTGRLGDCRIEALAPTANAGTNNGTPSAGSNYACVNEVRYDTTSYVTLTNTTGQEELYTGASLTNSPYQIFGVRVVSVAEKMDAGPAGLIPLVVSSSTEGDAASATTVMPYYAYQSAIFETDPHTSAAWTVSAVNSVQYGVKVA